MVEGYKRSRHPKLEVYRASVGKPLLHPEDPYIVAVATDRGMAGLTVPVIPLDDAEAVAETLLAEAVPLEAMLDD